MTDESSSFQTIIQENSNKEVDEKTQNMLNTPFSASNTALDKTDKAFLENLMKRIDSGEIQLLTPSSILNEEFYDTLNGNQKAKTDLFINSILFIIRQVYDFYHSEHSNDSDMMINMVKDLRLKKETLENELGDVLKI